MITDLETGVAAYLTTLMGANVSLTADTWLVIPTTGAAEKGRLKSVVTVRGEEIRRGAGSSEFPRYWDGSFEMVVGTDAEIAGAVALHQLVERAMTKAWKSATKAGLSAAVATASASTLTVTDFSVQGWRAGREDTRWLPVFAVMLAIDTDSL